jgi:hypothetical protein
MTQTMRQPTPTQAEEAPLPIVRRCYRIEQHVVGSPILTLDLYVHEPGRQVNGFCRITQATNPPLNLFIQLKGGFRVISYQGLKLTIVETTGNEDHLPRLPNFKLLLVLSDDWKTGTAEYEYNSNPADPHSRWQTIRDVEANAIPCAVG